MRTYRTLARPPSADWYSDDPQMEGRTVFEPDGGPKDTGLLDRHGVRIYAVTERAPIGFNRQ